MAQWIKHRPPEAGIAGSNPAWRANAGRYAGDSGHWGRPCHRQGQGDEMNAMRLAAYMGFVSCMLVGCGAVGESRRLDSDGDADVSPDTYFADVPICAGFRLVEPSFIYEGTQRRIGMLKYRGSGNVLDIVRYYRNAMVTSGWELMTAMGRSDRMSMTFVKKAEMCQIQVNKAGWGIEIIVQVGEDNRAR